MPDGAVQWFDAAAGEAAVVKGGDTCWERLRTMSFSPPRTVLKTSIGEPDVE